MAASIIFPGPHNPDRVNRTTYGQEDHTNTNTEEVADCKDGDNRTQYDAAGWASYDVTWSGGEALCIWQDRDGQGTEDQ